MHTPPPAAAENPQEEIATLVRQLHEIQQQLFALTGGEVDAVVHPAGHSYLLHEAQEKLRQREAELRESEERFRGSFEQAAVGIAHVSTDGVFLRVNDRLCAILGTERETLLGMTFVELTVPEDQADGREARRAMLAGEQTAYSAEKRYRRQDGRVVWVNLVSTLQRSAAGEPKYFISVFEDISARKEAEFRLHRLNRLHTVLSRTGEAIVRLRDRQQLYETVCRIVVADGGLRMSLIVELDAAGTVHQRAASGTGLEYLEELTVAREGPLSLGTIGTALRTGRDDFCNDFAGDPRMTPWAARAADYGFCATASFPLQPAGQVSGALVLFAGEAGYFQDDEIRLMRTVANDLSFALEGLEKELLRQRAESALRASEEQFASAFEYAAIGIALVAPDGHFLEVNRTLCAMLGYSEDELRSRTFQDITHPEDLAADLTNVEALLAGETVAYRMEKRYRHSTGAIVRAQLSVSLVRDEAGAPVHFIAQVQDLTEQRRVEAEAQRTAELLQAVAEGTTDALYVKDAAGRYLLFNAAAAQFVGRPVAEVLGQDDTALFSPEDARVVMESDHAVMATNTTQTTEEVLTAAGVTRTYLATKSPYRDRQGQVIGVIGISRDITERQRAEERIAEQAALLDQTRDAIIVRDLTHRVVFWNQGAARLFGWSAEEALGQTLESLVAPDPVSFGEALQSVLQEGAWTGEIHKTTKTGEVLTLDCRWTLMRDAAGAPRSILSIDTDITERKKIEEQFLRAQRMEGIGTLAAGIAHDLNNSLSPILMSIELLKLKFSDRDSHELLSVIDTSAQRASDLVRQVLGFARGVEGRRVEVALHGLVQTIEKIANDTFLKNIQVRTALPPGLWPVLGDPTQLHQVLLNLCVNARDAMPDGGTLTLRAENATLDEHYAGLSPGIQPGPFVALQIEDTGTGMPPEVLEKIFDPFFTTKEVGRGTGLGLSTTLAIVKSHGGFIRVASQPAKGTVFTLHLPAVPTPASVPATDPRIELPRGRGQTILVVDDEATVREITRKTLETFGYRVVLAAEGTEAIALYATHGTRIAALLTDMVMPGMDGPATIQILRKMNPHLPVIAASGMASETQVARATSLGVRHFLSKPFTADALLHILQQVLTPPGGG